MSLDLAASLRAAILENAAIVELLSTYVGQPSVHTRRPTASEATYPMIVISQDISVTDADFLVGRNPVVVRDISVYGQQPDSYRAVETVGYMLRQLFHRRKFAVPDGYGLIDCVASGPVSAPAEDEKLVGRMVSLTMRLQQKETAA